MPASSTVLAAVFGSNEQAEKAIAGLKELGLGEGQLVGAAGAPAGTDLEKTLISQGLPEGQARWYATESNEGRAVVLVTANGKADEARRYLLEQGGRDVGSQGGDLAGGDTEHAEQAQAEPSHQQRTTRSWERVKSRYEMLFEQRFGAGDATWGQYEPVYRWAWDLAISDRYAGHTWHEVEPEVQAAWPGAGLQIAWDDAAEAMRDVWTDISEEAGTIGDGGEAARLDKPLDVVRDPMNTLSRNGLPEHR